MKHAKANQFEKKKKKKKEEEEEEEEGFNWMIV